MSSLLRWLAAPALGLCALAFSPLLRAQPSPYTTDQGETDEVVSLPTFTVESETVDRYRAADAVSAVRIRTQLIETPSSISVLTRDFMEDVSPIRLHDAAKYVASVQDGTGIYYGDVMTIRGFPTWGRSVDNFNDALGYNYAEALIERLEVSKGPNAILSPNGAPGGTFNIVTKAPEFKRKHSLTGVIGDFDAQKVTLDMTDALAGSDRFAYRLIAAYQDSERYQSKSAKLRNTVIAPQFTWRISPTTELVTRYHYYANKIYREPGLILDSSVTQRGQTPIPGPGFGYKGLGGMAPWSGLNYYVHSAQFQLSSSLNKYITMRLAGLARSFKEVSDQSFLSPASVQNRYNPYTGILTPDLTWALVDPNSDHHVITNPYVSAVSPYYDPTAIPLRGERSPGIKEDAYAIQNDWVLSFETPLANLQTVAGFASTHNKKEETRFNGAIAPANLFDLANQDSSVVWDTIPFRDVREKYTNSQFYLNQRVSFWEDRISLNGGYLKYSTKTKSRDWAVVDPENTLDESKDMYLGSLLVRVTSNASLYYSYSTNASPFVANFIVRWREGKQREWGAKTEFFNRRLAINIAYFEITQTNVSTANPEYEAGDKTQPRDFLSDFDNYGTEIEISGALTQNLSVMGSFSKLHMRDFLGRHVNSISDTLAAGLVSYRFEEGLLKRLSLNIGFSYVGERAGERPPVDFTPLGIPTEVSFFAPGRTLWNAGSTYSWGRYQLRLTVDNLMGKKNYISGTGTRFAQNGLAGATGRNFRLAATVNF